MAVLVIIGLGIYLTSMMFTETPPRYRLETAGKKVGEVFRMTQTYATTTGQAWIIEFFDEGRRVRAYPRSRKSQTDGSFSPNPNRSQANTNARGSNGNQNVNTYQLPDGVRVQKIIRTDSSTPDVTRKILISSSGHYRPYTIHFAGENDQTNIISPNPITGEVQYLNDQETPSLIIEDKRSAPE